MTDGLSADHPSLIGSQVVRLEPEMIEIDAAGLVLLAHPSSDLRSAALKLMQATRALFFARKHAYDRAVSDRIAVLRSSQGLQPSAMASASSQGLQPSATASASSQGLQPSAMASASSQGLQPSAMASAAPREISELRARLVRAEQVSGLPWIMMIAIYGLSERPLSADLAGRALRSRCHRVGISRDLP